MIRLLCVLLIAPLPLLADGLDTRAVVEDYIVPHYKAFASDATDLANAAQNDCAPQGSKLVGAFHKAFDGWLRVSHLRFGPAEKDDRAYALAFWPDPRGKTPKALAKLIRDKDPAVQDAEEFSKVSIAARGFYALEFLMFDTQFADPKDADYRCALIQAVTADISANANAILGDWENGYAQALINPVEGPYRTSREVDQLLFTSLLTSLEFTAQARLGRPMGTFEKAYPKRAEMWRSGRSAQNVTVLLQSARVFAHSAIGQEEVVDSNFDSLLGEVSALEEQVFANIAMPQNRFRVEAVKQHVERLRLELARTVGPSLGVVAGFNSLDGD